MSTLAAIEPSWTRLAVPFLGVALFALAASFRQQRSAPVAALVVLTILLGLWMFGAGLVWSKRWPSMIRSSGGWVNDPGAWEWTALLGLAFVAVGCIGAALRAFTEGRDRPAWAYAGVALTAFAGWTAVVRYSVVLAVVGAALVLIALAADAMTRPARPAPLAADATRQPVLRALGIGLITAFICFWLIGLALALVLPRGG